MAKSFLDPSTSGDHQLTRRGFVRGTGVVAGTLAIGAVGRPTGAAASANSLLGAATASTSAPWWKLRTRMTGHLYLKGKKGYAKVAHGWNPRFDSIRPAAVARCVSAADVSAAVLFARQYGVQFSVRSGGHSLGGWSTCPGLVIDTTLMSAVAVDAGARTARIGGGAQLIDVYQAVANSGYAIPSGTCATVGLSGITSGGGIGILGRAWGLTCDQLVSATVVLADGKAQLVTPTRFAGLYSALRGGGGGSFGVITSLTMALHAAPTVHTYRLNYPFSAAAAVMNGFQQYVPYADPRFYGEIQFRALSSTGHLRLNVNGAWIGPASGLASQLSALVAKIGVRPTAQTTATKTYSQAMLEDAGCTSYGTCHVGSGGELTRVPSAAASSMVSTPLSSDAIQTLIAQVRAGLSVTNTTYTGVTVIGLGGAIQTPTTGSVFAHRSALFMLHYLAQWRAVTPEPDPARYDTYVRGFRSAMVPYVGTGSYVNYLDSSLTDYPGSYWPGTYPQLQATKTNVDPGNVFHFPQSVVAG